MGSTVTAEATTGERFGRWLADAMRRADMDIDRQMGGGRSALADAVGVSRSTVTRWMSGQVLPSAEQFEPLAKALGLDVDVMLVDSGIVNASAMSTRRKILATAESFDSGVKIPEHLDMKQLAGLLGFAPEEQEIFVAVVETAMVALRERRLRALGLPLDTPVVGRPAAE